jgi:hypothetical protein
MANTYLSSAVSNAGGEAMFPSAALTRVSSATNGTTTLTFSSSDAAGVLVGMTVTGAGITSGGVVTGVVLSTGVVTITGTITTLTNSNYVFTLAVSSSLHTTTPGTTGAAEVVGGSYARQPFTTGAPSVGVKTSTDAQNWVSMPSCTVGYFGFWTAVTGGTWLGGGALSSSLTVPVGATVAAAIGAITLANNG